ncbi:MAG TPA: DNA-binding protein [Firmicutes bacterium]|nr:DNA-binding protein [Bacillota bacterium]
MQLNESAQNYLETIYVLSKSLPVVRAIDIASKLNYKKSSVSVAIKNLRENEYITVTDAGYIYLTESGQGVAEKVYERHLVLTAWLQQIGVDCNVACEDACKMEHIISEESFQAIKKLLINDK